MIFSELVLVIYSLVCTIALIKAKATLNRYEDYFESYRKMSEEIENRLKNKIEKLEKES